ASVMLIGAGETGTLAVKHFRAAGVERFFIANKTLARATSLAESVGGVAVDFANIAQLLSQVDIVIGAATLGPNDGYLLERDVVQQALRERSGEPMFFIDLAVPRNFDPDVSRLSDAFLYNVDDLEAVVQQNLDARSAELERAQLIVNDEVLKFFDWLGYREVEPAIRDVRSRLDGFSAVEVQKTLRRLQRAGIAREQCDILEAALADMADALLAKTLHQPLEALRRNCAKDSTAAAVFREYLIGDVFTRSREPKEGS
ncbi:MAG: hypothetical protein KDD69_18000, partial [Bdellovibrionales bacterium]|nr:hypothetical protein [Bdellovibrionales bacterium]